MDWSSYKRICDRPETLSRWMLTQTRALIEDSALGSLLERALAETPIEKPADHRGGADTDMFVLRLSAEEVARIRDAVLQAVAAGRTTQATRTRGLGGFVEAWEEYRRALGRS